MIESTKGICLHYYKYSENSIIAKIFTENLGLQSYVIKGVRNKKSKNKLNILQSLNIVHLEVTNNKKRKIQYVKEISLIGNINNINSDMNKRFISLFISEILMKVLVESEKENPIFSFILETIYKIEESEKISKNFSLIFLIQLSGYLGFYPSKDNANKNIFNLESGCFTNQSVYFNISGDNKEYFKCLLTNIQVSIPYKNRKELLKSLQKYYSLHHYNIENLKSYEVIESLRI